MTTAAKTAATAAKGRTRRAPNTANSPPPDRAYVPGAYLPDRRPDPARLNAWMAESVFRCTPLRSVLSPLRSVVGEPFRWPAVALGRVGDLASAVALSRTIRAATIGPGTLDLPREALMQQLESVTGNILETHRTQREAPDAAAITHHDADRAELGVVR